MKGIVMATGIGFGKTILFGEHFVVYGLPAIASAIGDNTIATIEKNARTGKSGDGRVFIFPVDGAIRISTGQRGEDAI